MVRFEVRNTNGDTVATHTQFGPAWAEARNRMGSPFPTRSGPNFDVVRVASSPMFTLDAAHFDTKTRNPLRMRQEVA